MFVVAFGLGTLPGVLALAIHTAGALGKLFTEIVENADRRPAEGVRASGGNHLEAIRFGVLPQILASFASYTLLRFEINVREATVMGFVGAGGIGEELLIAIRRFYYSDVSAILLLIILTVFVLDMLTERLRGTAVSGGGTVKGLDLTAEEVAALAARHPALMHPSWRTRLAGPALTAVIAGLFVFGLWALGRFARAARWRDYCASALRRPDDAPDPQGHPVLFAQALAETLAISLLGTLAAAVLAFPVGLLAARNVVRNLDSTC